MQKVFFQSSLPRAGSTLFQNIIGQNPDFYVTPTSGVLELVYASRQNFSNSPEFKAQDVNLMTKGYLNFCKEGMEGFFNAITDKPYILDKSRGWGIHYNFLNSFYPDPKIVCLLRDPVDIMCSMEKNFRKNEHLDQGVINWSEMKGTTTAKRVDIWAQTPPIGMAFERLKEMVKQKIDSKVHFITFEDLVSNPEEVLQKYYKFIDTPYFNHDLNNVAQITQEDDAVYGVYGDHVIRTEVRPVESTAIEVLGYDTCMLIKKHYEWFYEYFY